MSKSVFLWAAGAVLVLALPLSAQSNATSTLMTYGDLVGGTSQGIATGMTPNTPCFLIPSLTNAGSNYLIGQTGDPNDALAVGIDQASVGRYFTAMADASGTATFNFAIPAIPSLLDADVWFQALSRPGGGGAAEYQDFSNLRWVNLNDPDRWQGAGSDLPVPAANITWAVIERGLNGKATKLFAAGGGPALLTDVTTPYHCNGEAWIYDAATGTTTLLPATLNTSRAFHTTTALLDGRVLLTGGITYGGQKANGDYYTLILDSTEIYDPATGQITVGPPMSKVRAGHTATLLNDGRVLVTGGTVGNGNHELTDVTDILGTALRSTEIFDPTTDTWSAGPNLTEPKAGQEAIKLLDGRVWVAGGITHTVIFGIPIPDFSTAVNLYDPATNSFSAGGNIGNKRALFAATLLSDGRIVVAGGAGGDIFSIGPIRQVHLWDPNGNNTTSLGSLPVDTAFAGSVTLSGDRVLVVGGAKGDLFDPIPISDVFEVDVANATILTRTSMTVTHGGGIVEMLEDGTVYVGGGESNSGTSTVTSESYSQ